MGKTNQKCEYCGFCTKNVYIYKRHKLRCRKDHGIGRGKKMNNQPMDTPDDGQVSGPLAEKDDALELGVENSPMQEASNIEEVDHEDGSQSSKKEKPAVSRNYTCTKCEFRSNVSRVFLYHLIEQHNAKFDIYACSVCEYCTRYRHKVQRHMKFAHKTIISYENVQIEYVCSGKANPAPVKPPVKRKTLMSKSMPGKKLMVKFMKKNGGDVTVNRLKAPVLNCKKKAPVEVRSSPLKSSDKLSRVVEETTGENGEPIFKCKECQFISQDKQKVAKHAVSWHVDTKSFPCSRCDHIAFEKKDFLVHRALHRNEHTFKCDECTFSSDTRLSFDRHLHNHQANYPYKCIVCTYSSASESAIKRHISGSHYVVPKESELPKSKNKTNSVIKTTGAEGFNSVKNKVSGEVSTSASPASKTSPYSSSKGSLLFDVNFDASSASMVPRRTLPPPNLEAMQFLMNELAPMRKLPPNISKYVKNENGKLVCPACKLKYKRSSDLNRHMKRKHGCKLREFLESDQALPPLSLTDDADDSYNDTYTGDSTNNMDDDDYLDQSDADDDKLDQSEQEGDLMELPTNNDEDDDDLAVSEEDLKCKYCAFTARWPSDLKRHMTVHSIEKRFKCSYCPKKYKYIGDMNVHIRKDHNKEPGEVKVVKVATIPRKKSSPALFKCPFCDHTSPWKSEIDRHSRLHTDDKTFQCRHCTYQTFWRGDIRRHVYKHHPEIMTKGVAIDEVIIIRNTSPEKLKLVNRKDQSAEREIKKELSPDKMEIGTSHSELQTDSENDLSNQTSPASMRTFDSLPTSLQQAALMNMETPSIDSKSATPSPIKEIGGGMYRCEYCGFMANAPSKMNSHIATHTNIKRYMCPLCGKRANWKWDISKHIRKDHNDQVTQVVKLSRMAAEETIHEYMETNPVVKRDHHLNNPEKAVSSDGSRQYYKCTACDYSEERRISVSRHIRSQHPNQGVKMILVKSSPTKEESPEKTGPVEKLLYGPSPASSSTPNKYSKMAENSTGSPESNRPFMCSECGKKGATKGDIKKHYHYLHADKEIRIIYLGDGSQSVYSAKADLTQSKIAEGSPQLPNGGQSPEKSIKPVQVQSPNRSSEPQLLPTVEPKALGYIRPFKCGICGRRSNWKWDISKHIKERHPGSPIDVITMSEQEARSTVYEYVQQEVPKLNKMAFSVPRVRKGKSPSPAKEGLLNTSIESLPEKTVEQQPRESSGTSISASEKLKLEPIAAMNMPTKGEFRQFKCGTCPYRSNWKGDVQRHITRRHKDHDAVVVMLKKDFAEATLSGYQYKKGQVEDGIPSTNIPDDLKLDPRLLGTLSGPLPRKAWAGLEKKIWRCSMCPYSNEDKVDVLKHLGKHDMKAYRCTLCNWTANFRSGVYRHIQSKHNGNKMALCRLAIKLIKEGPGNDNLGQAIVPESTVPEPQQPKIDEMVRDTVSPTGEAGLVKTRKAVYHCRLCSAFRSKWRSCVCRHLRKTHNNTEYILNCVKKIIKVAVPQSEVDEQKAMSPGKALSPVGQIKRPRPMNFHCNVCPYKTYKTSMLRFHMRCHTAQPGVKQFKCKYCSYYVNMQRLLNQHTLLHTKKFKAQKEMIYPKSPLKSGSDSPAAPKRHRCEKCPYMSNSKNDYLYHKQFHRPKPTADFKCDYCEYWVTHRRLLKQHMKIHGEAAYYMFDHPEQGTPTKSEVSENALVYDTVEIAEIKQRIIASKITPSISQSPLVSPMKIASNCSMGGKRGFLRKDGTYRKIHRCHNCPYMNIRLRNMRLHELMHGKRPASHPLIKCPHCDYHVGSKGLLAHHLKVHQPNYDVEMLGMDKERNDSVASEDSEFDTSIPIENKVDSLLEIARYKKYGCEKCPYASAKRSCFQRHVELHGSKQKCKCKYCDYSVPSANLLRQHLKLHFEPNQNLLAAQSILNLQHLPEMPADVALASMMTNNDLKNPVSITHDHLDLVENAPEDAEPKKIYRCDRCPYANVRRDHLLAHLRCHMTKNEYMCPYCDYSVGKTHVLVQHIKVHFNPLPELSEWITENGDPERIKEMKEKDINEALEIMRLFQSDKQKGNATDTDKLDEALPNDKGYKIKLDTKVTGENTVEPGRHDGKERKESDMEVDSDEKGMKNGDKWIDKETKKGGRNKSESANGGIENRDKSLMDNDKDKMSGNVEENTESYVCQYCDRDFSSSDSLVQHEMLHLIGNSYEEVVSQLLEAAKVIEKQEKTMNDDKPFGKSDSVVPRETSSDKIVPADRSSAGVIIVNQIGEKIGEVTPVKKQKQQMGDKTQK